MSLQPTIYEKIVTDILNEKDLPLSSYDQKEWTERGHNLRDFIAFKKDIDYAFRLLKDNPDKGIVAVANEAKEHVKDRKKENNLTFHLTDKEKQTVLEAEDKGRVKAGEVIHYNGYKREIKGADYMNVPPEVDAFVVFSGHPGSAKAAVQSWYNDFLKTGTPKKIVFLGLHDNQGNTNFENSDLKFNVGSEVEMYKHYFEALGVSKDILKECLVTPKDVSTADNIKLLAEIRNKFFDQNEDANLMMFGYPAYQKRIASEFSLGFQQMEDEHQVAGTNFYIADVPVETDEKKRYFSYDRLDGIAKDIIIGNCMAHPYRVDPAKPKDRYDSKLGKYPEEYKRLLPISLVYSYPNVANELAGTNTEVGSVMKILSAMQHKVNKWEDPKIVDDQIKKSAHELRVWINDMVPNDILSMGWKMSKNKWFKKMNQWKNNRGKIAENERKMRENERALSRVKNRITQKLKKAVKIQPKQQHDKPTICGNSNYTNG